MSPKRIGRPTSSEIWKLLKEGKIKGNFSAPGLTYIEEKRFEKELCRSLSTDHNARPTAWGNALEGFVYNTELSLEYALVSSTTIEHESGLFCGSPDLISNDKVADIKCPWTLLSFMQLRQCLLDGSALGLKLEYPEYYWQLVSNAVLIGKDIAELIVFMPKKESLDAIREYVDQINEVDVFKYKFIVDCSDYELPYIPEDSAVESLVRFSFEVPTEDKEALIEAVEKASLLINK